MHQASTGFWRGFWAPLNALKMIAGSPRLMSLVAVPLAVNIALYTLFFVYGANTLTSLVASFSTHYAQTLPPWLLSISTVSIKIMGWLVLALAAALSFTFISGLIAAPFNDSLSRATMQIRLKQTGAAFPTPGHAPNIGATVRLELKRMVILILGGASAALLSIIPLMQLPALMLGSLLVSFEYFGYPIAHRSSSLFPVFGFTLKHPSVSLGFGCFLLLMMVLPFASLIYIPLAVVGGTTLYADFTAKVPTRPT